MTTAYDTMPAVKSIRTALMAGTAALVFCLPSTVSWAQENDEADGETAAETDTATAEAELDGETIVVRGFRQSLSDSLQAKRNASQVVDVITAEELGQFPDQNITEAIQRVSGVQITRTNGEGESVSIRGLSPTFTRIEVDGRSTAVTIDSSDAERQSVLSVFASELYNTVEVVKSPTAKDVAGGIGGIVRLKTPDPLDVGELSWGVDGSITYGEARDEVEPGASGYYINTFLDDRIGVLVAGTYENRRRDIDKIQSNQDWLIVDEGFLADDTDPALLALVGGAYPGRVRHEQRVGEAPKYNANAKIQFQVTDALELYVNGLYTLEEREEDRARMQVQFSRGQLEGGKLGSNNTLTEAQFTRQRTEFLDFTRLADIETYGITAGGIWEDDLWTIKAEASTFSSEEDFTEFRVSHRTNRDGLGGYSIVNSPEYLELFTAATELALEDVGVRESSVQQRIISITEDDYRLDVERVLDLAEGWLSSVEVGVRYASTEFDRRQGRQAANARGLTYADGKSFILDGDFGEGFGDNLLTRWPSIDPVPFFNALNTDGSFTFDDPNRYTITEDVLAGYVMGNFDTRLFGLYTRGNYGVRFVQSDFSGDGRVRVELEDGSQVVTDSEPSLDADYFNVLPAFNIVLSQEEDSNLLVRAAITRALTRPTIDEINPAADVSVPDSEVDVGNPDLEPFQAWQYDLGVEYYFGESDEGLISAAFFYKDVENFITNTISTQQLDFGSVGVDARDFRISSFENGGEATIWGFEVGVQTPFTFLPGLWSNFGIYANYTYTNSEFTTEDGDTFSFPGASENAYNLVGYYDDGALSARLAYVYRDDFLIVPNSPNAQFGDEDGRLDLALRYRFDNGFRLAFDALNLTEEQNFKYYDNPDRLEDFEFEGRIYTFSVAYVY